MKVKDLIKLLQTYQQELEVVEAYNCILLSKEDIRIDNELLDFQSEALLIGPRV